MFEFKVTPDADTGLDEFKVTTGTRDLLVWEKTSKENYTLRYLLDTMSVKELYKVAHIAARRTGMYDGTLQDFETSCELFTKQLGGDSGPDPDPTQPDHSAGD